MLPLPSSSSSVSRHKYDVFLSFRGEDTRKNFTDHLYAALKGSGIITFRDDERLEAGEAIAPELLKAIQESWCSVIVFSETYAFSGWCLEELAEIVEQRKERGHKVFPIFYDVDPSDIRKQRGRVEEALAKHEEAFKNNQRKTQRWRSALTQVANLKGWHLNNRHESEFIRDIVRKISAKLCEIYSVVPDDLIGINTRLEELHSKIEIGEDDVRIIGICGMGGIGKTTLARAVYAQMSPHFEGKSFLADVREVSEKYGLVSLQKQLLSQILPGEGFHLFNVYDGNDMISRRLSLKKVLIVVDDVDNIQHLKCLVGRRDWFGSGSRIIVTTRDEHLLRAYGVDDVCKPTTLNANEALHLFSLKAFNGVTISKNDDFFALSEHVVEYAGGLPLALEVLGSFLCGRDVAQWRSAIERLKKDSNKEILDRLRISFDGLEETDKNIFLDIACFFNGEDKSFVIKILDGCGFFSDIGIDMLLKKSLLTVDEDDKLRMHDLLKEMGRKIVGQKSLDEPGKRCRLWEERDVYHVLTKNTVTEVVEGMIIDIKSYQVSPQIVSFWCQVTPQIFNFWEEKKMSTLSGDAFSKMKKLRLLRVFSPWNSRDLKHLSNELRLLEWHGYPFKALPSSFQPDNLVALLMPYSRIQQLWKENSQLEKLELVNLKGSQNLVKTPAFTMTPNLESLILEGCTQLVDVHPSIGVLRRLKLLNLRDCRSLRSLPIKFGMESLEKLILSGCLNLHRLPEIDGKMEFLQELCLDGTSIQELPASIGNLSSLKLLNLRDCRSLRSLPTTIGMECLETLILSGCLNLQRFPEIDGKMEFLLELCLDGTSIQELPASIGHLSNLKLLNLRDCKSFRSLPSINGMKSLEKLILSGCSNLQKFPGVDREMKCLVGLYLDGTGIEELPSSIGHLSNLVLLNLKDCKNLVSLPSSMDRLKCLKTLNLSGCSKVETLPEDLQQVQYLEELNLSETAIRKPQSFIFQFKNLKVLSFKMMQGRSTDSMGLVLSPLSGLTSLTELNLSDCNLCDDVIPSDICYLSYLETLNLSGNNFTSLPATLTRLSKLDFLRLSDCKRLKSLPNLLPSIHGVDIEGCDSLEVFANPTSVACKSWDSSYIFGINCYKLVENNNAALRMLKEYIKVCANANRGFHILIPGNEIPEWFTNQKEGSSIKILLSPEIRNDSKWMGIAFCGIFVSPFNDDDACGEYDICCRPTDVGGCRPTDVRARLLGFLLGGQYRRQRVMKDHLWLRYWCPQNLGNKNEEIELSFEPLRPNDVCAKIKKCGARIVYEKDLEEEEIEKQVKGSTELVKRKRNNYNYEEEEVVGTSKSSELCAEDTPPPPKRLQKLFNFITPMRKSNIN